MSKRSGAVIEKPEILKEERKAKRPEGIRGGGGAGKEKCKEDTTKRKGTHEEGRSEKSKERNVFVLLFVFTPYFPIFLQLETRIL